MGELADAIAKDDKEATKKVYAKKAALEKEAKSMDIDLKNESLLSKEQKARLQAAHKKIGEAFATSIKNAQQNKAE